MRRKLFDPSLLSVFRLFVGLRLIFSVLMLIAGNWFGERFARLNIATEAGLVETVLLLGYLSWPWLGDKLGKIYLPIALLVATVGPVVENYFSLNFQLNSDVFQVRTLAGQWQLIILLLLPVILIAWQYSFRTLVLSLLGLAALDSILFSTLSLPLELHAGPAFAIVLFRTAVLLLIGFSINRLSTEQREQNKRLAKANQQLASSANTLEQLTISRERNRMARELHDTLAHSLSAVAIQLEATNSLWDADPQQARSMLERSLNQTRDGLNEARRAIQALRSSPLDDLGLNLALRNLATSEGERGGYAVTIDIPEEMPRMDPEAEHGIYRIAEETLRNIDWHAAAKHVNVCMSLDADHLMLEIKDDGCGFVDDPRLQEEHYGLRGMRERAEALGAEFVVQTAPDQGTTVRLEMEVNHGQGIN